MVAREPAVVTISKEAKELISVGHSSSQTIHERNSTLQSLWIELKNLASSRKQKLSDALEAQKVRKLRTYLHAYLMIL